MPLFLMGCFPVDFQEVKRPLRTKSVKRPIKVGKRPINEGKRPIKAKVLVGVSVGCLMGCFREPPPWRKTAPLKRPIKSLCAFLSSCQKEGPGKYYIRSPPSPHFWPRGHFSGRGGGVYFEGTYRTSWPPPLPKGPCHAKIATDSKSLRR